MSVILYWVYWHRRDSSSFEKFDLFTLFRPSALRHPDGPDPGPTRVDENEVSSDVVRLYPGKVSEKTPLPSTVLCFGLCMIELNSYPFYTTSIEYC